MPRAHGDPKSTSEPLDLELQHCEPLCECWEPNPGGLQEVLNAERIPQQHPDICNEDTMLASINGTCNRLECRYKHVSYTLNIGVS